jgi:hypothetical protein
MRTFSILRALTLAVALTAPLAQVALAGQVEQQALAGQTVATSSFVGPYSDQLTAPSVGD